MFHGELDIHVAQGLKALRKRIADAHIPSSKLDESFNIATWNIRDFGKRPRRNGSIHFIAEILNQFDLIAITELRKNMADLHRVMRILGPYWHVVFSDWIGDWGGNWERVAYLFDKRAVTFTGFAAEADAPRKKNKKTGEYVPAFSWWRMPYIASFRAGNFDFVLITAHIRWGSSKKSRIRPLELLAQWIYDRHTDPFTIDRDIILMGDFNIPKVNDDLLKAITGKGLKIPRALRGVKHGSNLAKDKRYDQILHYPSETNVFSDRAGVLDFYKGGRSGIKELYPEDTPTKAEFTYEISDHLPLWIQINTDTFDEQLDQILNPLGEG